MLKGFAIPRRSDPRIFFILFFGVFLFHILTTPTFARSVDQLSWIVGSCLAFDLLFKYFLNDKIAPLSAVVSSLGIFVVIDTKLWWIYPLAAFLTIGSKYFIRLNGRHIFNPNNFAIVLVGTFLAHLVEPGGGMRWGGDLAWSIVISLLGLVLVINAKRALLSISFVLSFVLMSSLRAYFMDANLFAAISILLSPGLLVFAYFMVTDPRTSPNSPILQVFFAVSITAFDQLLRALEVRMSIFISLFVMTVVYALSDLYFKDKKTFDVWKYKIYFSKSLKPRD